jgi:hypothetical protein
MDAFEQLADILQLASLQFPLEEARSYMHSTCLNALKSAFKNKKFSLKNTAKFMLDLPAIKNEINWLLKHLYYSGLDKATNNACFTYIKHIRLKALERRLGNDFAPCKNGHIWLLPTSILDQIKLELKSLLLECPISYEALPYLMATYELHKTTYRWLTIAYHTLFSNIALLLTITSKLILESFKAWVVNTEKSYKRFLNVDTSILWIIDSVLDATLNLPTQISDIYVADISRCYEAILLKGPDNLLDALTYITNLAKQAATTHPRAETSIWVRISNDGTPANAQWYTRKPNCSNWFPLIAIRLLDLHSWLLSNCHMMLGDRVWIQQTGIPMDFSCSPIWCNMYLLAYEARFIQRLARLGRKDLLTIFQTAFRYIDDLCFINVQNPRDFLSPSQIRSDNNPFWTYPLNVLEIKEETSTVDPLNQQRGLSAHFMNVEISVNTERNELYTFKKFDKRRALPFNYTQYIKFKSNRCVKQAYNITISQLLPILYISNTNDAAIHEISLLINTMTNNGFNNLRLWKNICQFFLTSSIPGVKVDIQRILSAILQ